MKRSHTLNNIAATADSAQAEKQSRRWLNLGVLAHVDAGKTSLTEALLYAGGALDHAGRVDDGTTQTDTMAMERRRGITIRAAVACFRVGDVTVNLVDTPGHPDFIAEVDRSLAVLDAAVLVVSAVEGVQAQTIVLSRALRRLGVPAVIWINKIDRAGADPSGVVDAIERRLNASLVCLGSVRDQGTTQATFVAWDLYDRAVAEAMTARLAEHDDEMLEDWVRDNEPATGMRLRDALARLTRGGLVYPLQFGSARTGAGVDQLIDTLIPLSPAGSGAENGPASGQVFKIERTASGERVCSIRLRSGKLAVRDAVELGPDRIGTVTALEVHEPGGPVARRLALAGQIVRVHGLSGARVGDWIGARARTAPATSFPAPALQTVVVPRDPARRGDLHRALTDLADVDPLIRLRPDDRDGELQISVYGQVQQEVIADTLASDYAIQVDFQTPSVICVERPIRGASAIRRMGDPGHPHGFSLEVMVEPAPAESGVELVVTADRLSLPLHVYGNVEGFRNAVLGYLQGPLSTGPHGWSVTDVRITVTESGYPPAGPSAAEVRYTVVEVVGEALRRAGTVVCEPVDRFWIETPADTLSSVLNILGRLRAIPDAPEADGGNVTITGSIPSIELDELRAELSTAAHGEAILESALEHHSA